MLVAIAIAATTSFVLPTASHIALKSRFIPVTTMTESDSDRYQFNDPTTILDNFFGKRNKKPTVMTGFDKDGKTGAPSQDGKSGDKGLDLVADSCIDWGALSPREVAAAFMMLKGGSKDAATTLLTNVMAELETMEDKDWGLLAVDEDKAATAGSKPSGFYSGL